MFRIFSVLITHVGIHWVGGASAGIEKEGINEFVDGTNLGPDGGSVASMSEYQEWLHYSTCFKVAQKNALL